MINIIYLTLLKTLYRLCCFIWLFVYRGATETTLKHLQNEPSFYEH